MADELQTKRIIELAQKTGPEAGDNLAVDNATSGTRRILWENLLDENLADDNKAAPAGATGRAIEDAKTTVRDEIEGVKSELNNVVDQACFKWELGSLDTNLGTDIASTTRIRSTYVPVTYNSIITVSGNSDCLAVHFYDVNGQHLGGKTTWTGNTQIINEDNIKYVRIAIRKSSSNDTIDSTEISTQGARCTVRLAVPKEAYAVNDKIGNADTRITALSDTVSYSHAETVLVGNHLYMFDTPIPSGSSVTITNNSETTAFSVNFIAEDGTLESISSGIAPGGSITAVTDFDVYAMRCYCNSTDWDFTVAYGDELLSRVTALEGLPADITQRSFNASYNNVLALDTIVNRSKPFTNLFGGRIGSNPSKDIETFLFFTDPHFFTTNDSVWRETMPRVLSQMQKYYNSLPLNFCLCGGDWLTSNDNLETARFRLGYIDGIMRSIFDKAYLIVGNHDTNYQTSNGTARNPDEISTDTLTNLWYRKYGKCYYSFKGENTTFYVFDTGTDWDTTITAYRTEQLEWLADALDGDNSPHIALAMHIIFNMPTDETPSLFAQEIGNIIEAYNNRSTVTVNGTAHDYASATGVIEFVIAGHLHADKDTILGGVPCIITKNTMVPGWTSPTFDLIYADYGARTINAIRVGSGVSRSFQLL